MTAQPTPQILLPYITHAVEMASRPAILDSRILRVICPLQRRSRHLVNVADQSTIQRPWSHPPASVNIDNDQVARLASRPLHPLTLADLVRYQLSHLTMSSSRVPSNWQIQTWPPTPHCRDPLLLRKLHPVSYTCPPRASHTSSAQSSIHCGLQSSYISHLQLLRTFPFHPASLPRAEHHQFRR